LRYRPVTIRFKEKYTLLKRTHSALKRSKTFSYVL